MKSPTYILCYGIAAVVLWLVPFFWSGWTGRNVQAFPRILSFQHTAAGLFTAKSTRWWDHHIELQAADNSRHELNERSVFPMGAFGYRTRYDRIMNESERSRIVGQIRQRIAEHVVAKALNDPPPEGIPAFPGAKAVRLVRTSWPVGIPEMAQPKGKWDPPPVTEALPEGVTRDVKGTYKLQDGKVIEVKAQPASRPPARVVRPPAPGVRQSFRLTQPPQALPPTR